MNWRCLGQALLLASLLLPLEPVRAAGSPQVVDLLPRNANRPAVRQTLAEQLGQPVELLEPDPLLIEAQRWARPDVTRTACELAGPTLMAQLPEPPAGVGQLFPRLMERASRQLRDKDYAGALQSVASAREMLPCVAGVVPQEQVRALFLYEAVAHVMLGDGKHSQAFLEMLAVDPRLSLDADLPQKVQDAFLTVSRQHMKVAPLPVDPWGFDGELFIDGQPSSSVSELRPGRHLLQLRNSYGGLRSALLAVAPVPGRPDAPVRLATLTDFGLASAALSRDELGNGLAVRRLDPFQRDGLELYLARSGKRAIAFAIDPAIAQGALLRIYLVERGMTESIDDWLGPAVVVAPDGTTVQKPRIQKKREKLPSKPRFLAVGLEGAVQGLVGTENAFLMNERVAGMGLRLDFISERLVLGARVGRYAVVSSLGAAQTGCGGYTGEGAPTTDQVEGAAACLEPQPGFLGAPLSFGAGIGMLVDLSYRVRMQPSIYVEGVFLPNTLVRVPAGSNDGVYNPGEYVATDALLVGPVARNRLSMRIYDGVVRLEAGVEVFAGILLDQVKGQDLFGVPFGATGGVGMAF